MTREKMLMELYRNLWRYPQFEADFQIDWLAAYQILLFEDDSKLPDNVLEMCYEYMIDWFNGG